MLRVLPWIADGATSFLDGFLFNRAKKGKVSVFEFGLGNSTLYFLSKGCYVTAVDHDSQWVDSVRQAASAFHYDDRLDASAHERPYHQAYVPSDYDIISVDGRDRVLCLKHVLEQGIPDEAILLLDNTERVSGGRYAEYTELLGDFHQIHFEQPCVPGVSPKLGNYVDRSGNRVEHRWVTTVAYRRGGRLLTTSGKPF